MLSDKLVVGGWGGVQTQFDANQTSFKGKAQLMLQLLGL